MAGRGPAPKSVAQRRNHHAPVRGDWVALPPLKGSVLPALPKRTAEEEPWNPRTKRAWEAWRKDPATVMYGPPEIQQVIDLAYLYEDWVRASTSTLATEIRHRQDSLGLTPKGKQDRRWQVVAEDVEADRPAQLATVRKLKIVGD